MCLSSNERGIDHFGLPLAIVRDSMKGRSPTLIHISGIDSFLGKRLLAESDKAASSIFATFLMACTSGTRNGMKFLLNPRSLAQASQPRLANQRWFQSLQFVSSFSCIHGGRGCRRCAAI